MDGHCRTNPLAAVVQGQIQTVSTIPAVGIQIGIGITVSISTVREEVLIKVAGEQHIAHQRSVIKRGGGLHRVIYIGISNNRQCDIIRVPTVTVVVARIAGVTKPAGSSFIRPGT